MSRVTYLTTAEMAEETGKSADFWARLCKSGQLAAVKLGNDWRVSTAEFERFMRGGSAVARPGRLSSRGKRSA